MRICSVCGTENPDGFRFCGQCGTALLQATPERRKTATILFCDVSGSTALGERLAHEDDALRAVRAATDMLARLEELNDEFEGRFGSRIGLRIGINTGEVVAGDASAGETFVSGDPVNVAARLEQTAAVGEVLLGELTWRLTRQAVRAEPVEPLALKGKAKPVPAYRLLGLADGTPARVARAGSALVGREEELASLHRELDAAIAERSCRLVAVI